eukprot:39804-Eustigmatos_ZCMA.PRE.1
MEVPTRSTSGVAPQAQSEHRHTLRACVPMRCVCTDLERVRVLPATQGGRSESDIPQARISMLQEKEYSLGY